MSHAAIAPLRVPELYRSFAGYVRRALVGLGIAGADADDLTHDVFVTLHRKGTAFDDPRSARAWLYGTARRLASNHRRAQRRAQQRELHAPAPAPAPLPDAALDRRDAARVVDRFAATLSPNARAVFELSEVQGLATPDVAQRLSMPLNTAYSHVRRVRSRLSKAALTMLVLALVALSMLAGRCASEGADERPRVALRAGAGVAG
ncbi:MAG: sigma-70 family RNA polymerase sigma factor [Myxococcota bacterium]